VKIAVARVPIAVSPWTVTAALSAYAPQPSLSVSCYTALRQGCDAVFRRVRPLCAVERTPRDPIHDETEPVCLS
jgi:hypothetical protein